MGLEDKRVRDTGWAAGDKRLMQGRLVGFLLVIAWTLNRGATKAAQWTMRRVVAVADADHFLLTPPIPMITLKVDFEISKQF